jgi:hypothetical protein
MPTIVVAGKALPLRRATLIIMVVLGLSRGIPPSVWGGEQVAEKVTDADIRVVITAVEDEIYANGYHTVYIDVGADKVPIYVNPRIENGMVWVIYKLMPHGEIHRGVVLSADKRMAMLHKDPQLGFPATDTAAIKTVYLNDDDVIEMKTTWRKVYMRIDLKPSAKLIEEAKQREAIRYGGRR